METLFYVLISGTLFCLGIATVIMSIVLLEDTEWIKEKRRKRKIKKETQKETQDD